MAITQESSLSASSMFLGSMVEKRSIVPLSLFKEAIVSTPKDVYLMIRFGGCKETISNLWAY